MHAVFVYRVDSRTATAKSVHLSRFSIVEQVAISSCLIEIHEHHCHFDSAFDNCTVSCEIVLLIQLSVNSIVDACCKHMTSSFLTSPDNSPKESAPLLVTRSDTCTPTHQRFQHTGVQIPTGWKLLTPISVSRVFFQKETLQYLVPLLCYTKLIHKYYSPWSPPLFTHGLRTKN